MRKIDKTDNNYLDTKTLKTKQYFRIVIFVLLNRIYSVIKKSEDYN